MENDQINDVDVLNNEEIELELPEQEAPANEDAAELKARLEQLERENKKLKRQAFVKPKSSPTLPNNLNNKESLPTEIVEKVNRLDLIESKRQFGYEHGLSPEETDFIFQATGGKPSKEILETPFIKHGLEGYRASKRLEANTPGSSARGSVFAGKNFEELKPDERANAFNERMKQIRK